MRPRGVATGPGDLDLDLVAGRGDRAGPGARPCRRRAGGHSAARRCGPPRRCRPRPSRRGRRRVPPRPAGRSAGRVRAASRPRPGRPGRTRSPSSTEVCTSCPQAWQAFGTVDRYGTFFSSLMGSASRSARRATSELPADWSPMSTMSPVPLGMRPAAGPPRLGGATPGWWSGARGTRVPGARAGPGGTRSVRPRVRRGTGRVPQAGHARAWAASLSRTTHRSRPTGRPVADAACMSIFSSNSSPVMTSRAATARRPRRCPPGPLAGPTPARHGTAGRGFSAGNTTGTQRRRYGENVAIAPVMDPVNPHPAENCMRVTACARRVRIALNGRLRRVPHCCTGRVPAQVIMVSRDQVIRWGCAIVAVRLTLRDAGGPGGLSGDVRRPVAFPRPPAARRRPRRPWPGPRSASRSGTSTFSWPPAASFRPSIGRRHSRAVAGRAQLGEPLRLLLLRWPGPPAAAGSGSSAVGSEPVDARPRRARPRRSGARRW